MVSASRLYDPPSALPLPMKSSTFLSLYGKLEHLVLRLPLPLQQPILREITPIKTLFLLQRAPRLVLLGAGGTGKRQLLDALFGEEVLLPGAENLSDGAWQEIGHAGRGTLKLLDARRPASLNMLRAALAADASDLFIFLREDDSLAEAHALDLDHAQEILALAESQHGTKPRLLGVLTPRESGADLEQARQELAQRAVTQAQIEGASARVADRVGGTGFEFIAQGLGELAGFPSLKP